MWDTGIRNKIVLYTDASHIGVYYNILGWPVYWIHYRKGHRYAEKDYMQKTICSKALADWLLNQVGSAHIPNKWIKKNIWRLCCL